MAHRIAAEFQDGWIVNLGVGMPTMCSDFVVPGRIVIFHSENGVIGYGRRAVTEEEATPYVVNAGGGAVVLQPFASIVHHADSFAHHAQACSTRRCSAPTRSRRTATSRTGRSAGRTGGGIGGAMDIAACAQQIFVIMEHTLRNGAPRLLSKCTLPLTAPRRASRW